MVCPAPALFAPGSLKALLSLEHVPTLRAWVCVYSRTVAWAHDRVRENGAVTFCRWKLQRSDDGDSFTAMRRHFARPEFREPHAAVFLHDDSGRTPGRLGSLSACERVEMPVDGRLTELEFLDRADVETAELGPLLTRRHVDASHFRQVLVLGRARRLSLQLARRPGCQGFSDNTSKTNVRRMDLIMARPGDRGALSRFVGSLSSLS